MGWRVFANFAAKRHFNGPLRAVSPVADNYAEVDWKLASKQAKRSAQHRTAASPNSLKLIHYIDASLKGQAAPEALTLRESSELFMVEAISLLLPLIYILGVLFAFSTGVYFFSEPMVESILAEDYLTATHWACPAVICLGLMYILLRPIFGGFRSYHGRVLQRHEAPALFELVQQMSRHLNVRPPKRIEINNETAMRVDAYSGINSIYRDEYKLIIGAPLIMSMSLNELSAMIAHELSHFRCKHKKVAFYLMHHVSEWLYFRASGQDKRHQNLLKRMQKENISFYEYGELWTWQRIHLLQQWTFASLYHIHRRLTAWKCRQIEFETDAMAIKVAGTQAFQAMFMAIRRSQFAQKAVSLQNDWAWKDGYLLDDYALAVSLEARKISQANVQQIQQGFSKTISYFCPNDLERMQAAKALPVQKGLLKAAVEARYLLEQPSLLSKQLTLLDYHANSIKMAHKFCVSSEKIRALKQKKDAGLTQAKRYFDNRGEHRILKFEPTHERDVSQFDIQQSIDHIRAYRVEDRKHQSTAMNLFKRIEKTYIVERLRASKLPVHKYMPEDVIGKKEADAYLTYMQEQYGAVVKQMEQMDQVFYQRAHECLNLLAHDARSSVIQSFHNLELYCQVRHLISRLVLESKPLKLIASGLHNGASTRILQAGANEKQVCWETIRQLREQLTSRPIRVVVHGKPVHILKYLDYKLGAYPERSSQVSIMMMTEYVEQLLQLLDFQYHKWQGQLALVCSQFEHQNGITQVNLLNRY